MGRFTYNVRGKLVTKTVHIFFFVWKEIVFVFATKVLLSYQNKRNKKPRSWGTQSWKVVTPPSTTQKIREP